MALMFAILSTALAAVFQNQLIYHPSRDGDYNINAGFPIQSITFEAADGTKLNGAFIPAANPRGAILWCHGNGGNLSNGLYVAGEFRQLGLSVFLFDYRGYGK